MSLLPLFLCAVLAATPVFAAAPPSDGPCGPGWRTLWQDQFEGNALDPDKWSYELGAGGWGNQELQEYTASQANLRVEGGELKIQAVHDAADGSYTSARIRTKGKFDLRFGRVSARMRLPSGQGPWPAFWMLGAEFDAVGWPYCGEIDVLESGRPGGVVSGAIHFAGKQGRHDYYKEETVLPRPGEYHVYAIEWDSSRIVWTIDGKKFFSRRFDEPYMEAFTRRFFLLLNLAVGGPATAYTGFKPPDPSVFPQTLTVDWVLACQKQ
jgi:beta-glucanase (GH16 family)